MKNPPPYIPKEIEPVIRDVTIDDCIFKTYTWYTPQEQCKGRIIFVHGYRDSVELYYRHNEFYALNGYDYFFFDQRGEGKTKLVDGTKGFGDDNHAYKALDDFIELNLKEMKEQGKNSHLHLMSHSMGGGIALNYAINGKYRDKIKTLTTIGPLITLHPKTDPGLPIEYLVRSLCMFNFGKKIRVKTPLKHEYLTGDKDYQNFIQNKSNTENLDGAFVEARDFILRGRNLLKPSVYSKIDPKLPVLICHGECDFINDIEGSKSFMHSINSIEGMENKVFKSYPNGRHALHIDIPEVYLPLETDLLDFINKHND